MSSFGIDVKKWCQNTKTSIADIYRESAIRVLTQATTTQPGVKRTGGRFVRGRVPVDTGRLIGTCQVWVGGRMVATGVVAGDNSMPPDIRAALAGMPAGTIVELRFTAPYARAVEYGTSRMAGRFYIRQALLQWNRIVEDVALGMRART